jgi:hypothetical protein
MNADNRTARPLASLVLTSSRWVAQRPVLHRRALVLLSSPLLVLVSAILQRLQIFDKMALLLRAQMQSEEVIVVFNHFTHRPKPPIVVEAAFRP